MNKLPYLLILVFSILFNSSNAFAFSEKNEMFQALSFEEREELETFFRKLFRESAIPYTLFGNKPLSFYDYLIKGIQPGTIMPIEDWYVYLPEKNYLIYEKYKPLLISNNYLIVDQLFISKKFPTTDRVRDFIVINKRAFIETVEQNIMLFQERLGAGTTAQSLWEEMKSGRSILCDILKEDELLWGILLGFGRHNSQLFVQGDHHLKSFHKNFFVDLFQLPGFHCDPNHTETQKLKREYLETQKIITKIYNSPDFLDIVLKKLHE